MALKGNIVHIKIRVYDMVGTIYIETYDSFYNIVYCNMVNYFPREEEKIKNILENWKKEISVLPNIQCSIQWI